MSKISGLEWTEMSEATREQISQKLMHDIDGLRSIRAGLLQQLDEKSFHVRLLLGVVFVLALSLVATSFWIAFHR